MWGAGRDFTLDQERGPRNEQIIVVHRRTYFLDEPKLGVRVLSTDFGSELSDLVMDSAFGH